MWLFETRVPFWDCAISRIMYAPVDLKLLDEILASILLLYKIKTIDFLFLFSELATKM